MTSRLASSRWDAGYEYPLSPSMNLMGTPDDAVLRKGIVATDPNRPIVRFIFLTRRRGCALSDRNVVRLLVRVSLCRASHLAGVGGGCLVRLRGGATAVLAGFFLGARSCSRTVSASCSPVFASILRNGARMITGRRARGRRSGLMARQPGSRKVLPSASPDDLFAAGDVRPAWMNGGKVPSLGRASLNEPRNRGYSAGAFRIDIRSRDPLTCSLLPHETDVMTSEPWRRISQRSAFRVHDTFLRDASPARSVNASFRFGGPPVVVIAAPSPPAGRGRKRSKSSGFRLTVAPRD